MSERKLFRCVNEECDTCKEGAEIRGRYRQDGKLPHCADCESPYQEDVQAATTGRVI